MRASIATTYQTRQRIRASSRTAAVSAQLVYCADRHRASNFSSSGVEANLDLPTCIRRILVSLRAEGLLNPRVDECGLIGIPCRELGQVPR